MKIVIATPLYPPEPGGPSTYAKLLEQELPKTGIEVTVVKFSEVRHLPKLVRHFAYYRRVLAAARSADAVLALDPVSVGLPAMWAARRAGKPFVVKIVGDYAWEQGQQRFGVTASLDEFVQMKNVPMPVRLLQRVQARVARSAARVIAPSAYLKRIVSSWGVPSENIEVLYNSIEVPPLAPLPNRLSGFLVVSSGRRVPWKGFEALARVVARDAAWHLHIASDVSRQETLQWVSAADVFVLNSSYEGLSHALIEAMTLGTPVIATRVGGNAELIEDGVTGLLVPFGDDEALFEAISSAANDTAAARERAAAAHQFISEKFSVDTMLSATATLLSRI